MPPYKKVYRKKISRSLQKATKEAQVHVLREGGASYRDIANMLHIGQQTVADILKTSNEEMLKVKSIIQRKQMLEDYHIADIARQKIEKELPNANFRDTVGAWKIARDLQAQGRASSGSGNTVNVHIHQNKDNVVIASEEAEIIEE